MERITITDNLGGEMLSQLSEEEWLDLYNRLRLFIGERYYGLLADEDLIAQAFVDVVEGTRAWQANKSPFENLRSIIGSLASNLEACVSRDQAALNVLLTDAN